jgi:hypothetical protein
MFLSPQYQEIVEEAKREGSMETWRQAILEMLEDRFGPDAKGLEVELKAIPFDRLRELYRFAIKCSGLAGFRERLSS